ncbi:MAG: TetR/AcrR family transcriptional regulator [Actinomycetota bacterium]|nr:TetR/AcrR family transcriptional regulator [Actinomycetota bacterium]
MSSFPQRPSRADAQRNEQRILDATAETIAVEPAASLEKIARRAGVSRTTLYAHFASRDALMDALTARSVEEVTTALTGARPAEDTAVEAMDRVLIAAWDTVGRYRGLVIVNQRLDPADLGARTAPATALVHALIIRGQHSGEFDRELRAEWLLTVVVDLIHVASRQVTSGMMDPRTAQRALLRSAAAVLRRA